MKKYLLIFVGIISFLGISSVKADGLSVSTYYDNFDTCISLYLQYEEQVDYMISYWAENYSDDYPYYFVSIDSFMIYLQYSSSNSTNWITYSNELAIDDYSGQILYNFSTSSYLYNDGYLPYFLADNTSLSTWAIINHGFIFDNDPAIYDSILFPSYTSNNYNFSISQFEIQEGDYVPAYLDLYNDTYNQYSGYTEINLNDYSYVALSLRDYTVEDEFYSNVYVKGQYCVTPVYNYGLLDYSSITNSRVPNICSPYYDTFTQIRMYVTEDNLNNHAIYYLKSYDTSRENKVRIDSSIFNIHYITSQNENNPILEIGGRSYSIIPYSELSSSATSNTGDGYIPGNTCLVGDFNCTSSYNSISDSNLFDASGGFNFSDIFTKPLEVLTGLWQAIVTVFTLITSLISVLPLPMQYFLYLSFMLAIVLGLIKIIL